MLRKTHAVSSRTVLDSQTGPAAKSRRAAAACSRSSSVNNRTRILVSAAVMPPPHFPCYGGFHLRQALPAGPRSQAPRHILQAHRRKESRGPQQNTLVRLLDDELRPRLPRPRIPDVLRQNYLTLG